MECYHCKGTGKAHGKNTLAVSNYGKCIHCEGTGVLTPKEKQLLMQELKAYL